MALWHLWTASLSGVLLHLATLLGGSEALAILALTLGARLLLFPVSFTAALRMDAQRRRLAALKPALDALKERHRNDAAALSAATMRLYRENDIRFLDRLALANLGTQAGFGLGLYQVLRASTFSSRFLWIPSLARPDLALTALVGVLMLLAMAVAPGMGTGGEAAALMTISISVVVGVVAVSALPSSVGLYWAASNLATLGQSLVLRRVVARRRSPA
jgi:YidC/Oxa1 family membrane protein insertase